LKIVCYLSKLLLSIQEEISSQLRKFWEKEAMQKCLRVLIWAHKRLWRWRYRSQVGNGSYIYVASYSLVCLIHSQ